MALVDVAPRAGIDALDGLDALDLPDLADDDDAGRRRHGSCVVWSGVWPKLVAVAVALAIWQVVVWSGWRPEYVLPGPLPVGRRFADDITTFDTWRAVATTMRRGVTGFAFAVVIGGVLGLAVSRFALMRTAIGTMLTGLQTMPSIAWFPLALLLFQFSESAIYLVVVLGAAPSIANGVIAGVDHVPPLLSRAGRSLGATGARLYRHVVVPAALPSVVAGLKQGWAFAWRSLLAGELIVVIANQPSLGSRLEFNRQFSDTKGLISVMLLILVIGMAVDGAVFSPIDRALRRRRGLATD